MSKSKRILTERITDNIRVHHDTSKGGTSVVTLEADSLSALTEFLRSDDGKPTGGFAFNPSSRQNKAKPDWDLSAGWDGAVKVATLGWEKGRKHLQQVLTQLSSTNGTAPIDESDVAGGDLDVAAYVAGDPCHYDCDPEEQLGGNRVIRLLVPLSVNWTVDAKCLLNRGAAIASVIDSLEAKGLQTEVVCYSVHGAGKGQAVIRHTVKRAGEHLSTDRIAASIAHPATFRRINFAGLEYLGDVKHVKSGWAVAECRGGYGSPEQLATLDLEEIGSILFPPASSGGYGSPEQARQTLSKVFESAGLRVDYT